MAHFTSGGKSITIESYEPSAPGPHPAILLLHGSGGNIGFWTARIAPYLDPLKIALYAVHYFDRTGTSRATPALILDGVHYPQWLCTVCDAMEWVRSRPGVDAERIGLLGVSLGAFLAVSAAANPSCKVRAVVEISGGMPAVYAQQAGKEYPPTLILHGTQDTIVPVSEAHALDALLSRLGVPHKTEILDGQGHWFDSASQMRILSATARFLEQYL